MIDFYGLVLAAGMGKRLRASENDTYPKVLRQVDGRHMVLYVLDALHGAGVDDICVVIGVGAELVREALGGSVTYAVQPTQEGSGHATKCAREALAGKSRHIVLMCGDSPLFTSKTIQNLMREHVEKKASITLLSAELDDPFGYGRIVRRDGQVTAIVEEKNASPEDKLVREINGGCYAFDADWLWANIDRIERNETGELYLTDMVQFAIEDGLTVVTSPVAPEEILGVNNPEQLKEAEEVLRRRQSDGARC